MWNVLLYDLNDNLIMDISRFVEIDLDLKLNENSTLRFDVDLMQFEKLCESVGANPRNIIYPARTEIKVARNNNLLFGGIIAEANTSFGESGAKITVTADSYLQYFEKRLLSKLYTNTDRSQIAWNAIQTVQAQPNGNLGITQGTLATVYKSDLTADLRDVKSIIKLYTYAKPTTYDFEITPDKVFNTYLHLGSYRPEYPLIYPQNIVSVNVPRSADTLYNRIYGIGSGIGEERLQTVKNNATSQLAYRLRENKQTFNSVSEMTTLEHNTEGYLNEHYGVLVTPEVTVTSDAIDLDVVRVGDTLPVKIDGSTFNDDVNGDFRIYGMKIKVDQNGFETITLDFYKPDAGGDIDE